MNANKMYIRYVESQDEICIAKVGDVGAPVLVIPATTEALVAVMKWSVASARTKFVEPSFFQRVLTKFGINWVDEKSFVDVIIEDRNYRITVEKWV